MACWPEANGVKCRRYFEGMIFILIYYQVLVYEVLKNYDISNDKDINYIETTYYPVGMQGFDDQECYGEDFLSNKIKEVDFLFQVQDLSLYKRSLNKDDTSYILLWDLIATSIDNALKKMDIKIHGFNKQYAKLTAFPS